MTYSREVKAQALVLMKTGVSAQSAAEELGLEPRTVQMWGKRLREISPEELPQSIRDEDLKIVSRAQDLIHEAFDEIEEIGEARKYLIPLNAVKGTAQDKEHRSRESNPTRNVTNYIIIKGAVAPTDAMEGEFTEA